MEKLDFQEEEKEEEKFAGISLKLFIKEYDLADKLGEGINSDVIKIKKKVGFCFLICRKIYARSDFEELTLINNMMHEIGILDRLDHDGIPKVLKSATVVDHTQQKYYLVMDYIAGQTLDSYIEKKQKIGSTILKDITKRLLEITNHCHLLGVVHRDIKPSNILINESNKVYLVDFNLAKYIEDDEDNPKTTKFKLDYSSPKCSYLYAAPELHVKDAYFNESTDVYSIGIVLYILIFGMDNYQACKKGKDCVSPKSHKKLL